MRTQLKLIHFVISSFFLILFSCHSEKKENNSSLIQQSIEQSLLTTIAKYPDSLLAKENLIQYYRDNNYSNKALSTIEEFLSRDSNNYKLNHMKAVVLLELGDTIKALSAFQNAINIEPKPTDLIFLGHIYALQKNPTAMIIADSLANKAPYQKEALYIKGVYFASKKEFQKSILCFNQCISIDYTFMEAYREKAKSLFQLKEYQEAINVLSKATTIQNSFAEGYYLMGQCYENIHNKNKAIEAYQKCLLFDPDYTDANNALSRLGL